MKNILFLIFFIPFFSKGQESIKKELLRDAIILRDTIYVTQETSPNRYKLYSTKNMWNFLKLDTRTGRIWQVQYSMDAKKGDRVTVDLNTEDLTYVNDDKIDGRFELYPTENMYTFILLDKLRGFTWQAHWSIDPKERGIIYISN